MSVLLDANRLLFNESCIMARSRTPSRYPCLPLGVENLLALHGLEARPERSGWNRRGNYKWQWMVTKINAPAGIVVHTALSCWKDMTLPVLWRMTAHSNLQVWIDTLVMFERRGYAPPFILEISKRS